MVVSGLAIYQKFPWLEHEQESEAEMETSTPQNRPFQHQSPHVPWLETPGMKTVREQVKLRMPETIMGCYEWHFQYVIIPMCE